MNKIRWAMMGGGSDSLIGVVHRIAAYMSEKYTLVGGVFSINEEESRAFAKSLDLDQNRVYPDINAFVDAETKLDPSQRVEVVTVATPNFLHFPMAKQLLEAGFNVICEKPMTMNVEEAIELETIVKKMGNKFALTHTYTGYPMVRQMRTMVRQGVIGEIQKVDAQYYQGWINPIIHDSEKRKTVWRLDPEKSGISCCYGDIGVHAFNLIEYVTGLEVQDVLSDLDTLYEDNTMDVDGTTLLRFKEGCKGLIRASQVATGEENNITVAVYGRKGALKWEQENPNYLVHLSEDEAKQVLKPGHEYNDDFSLHSTKVPPGHPEGIFDAMGNIYKGLADDVRGQDMHPGSYPTVSEGVRGMKFMEQVVASSRDGNIWKQI